MKDSTKRKPHAFAAGDVFDAVFGTEQGKDEETKDPGETLTAEREPTEFRRFVGRNPTIFHKTNLKGHELPKGWMPLLERGIFMVKAMELSLQVRGFNIREGRLYALGDNSSTGLDVLNELLAVTRCTCPACGKQVEQTVPPEDEFSNSDMEGKAFTFCENCLCKAGFVPPAEVFP